MTKRLKIDFKEKRNIDDHKNNKLDLIHYLEIWNASHYYFDSKRQFGYGGYYYDSRWKLIIKQLKKNFKLTKNSNLLDVGCAKGYLVNDYNLDNSVGKALGIDISLYPLIMGKRDKVVGNLICANSVELPFENNAFDLVFCKDTLHNILNKKDTLQSIIEIERTGKKKSMGNFCYNLPSC